MTAIMQLAHTSTQEAQCFQRLQLVLVLATKQRSPEQVVLTLQTCLPAVCNANLILSQAGDSRGQLLAVPITTIR